MCIIFLLTFILHTKTIIFSLFQLVLRLCPSCRPFCRQPSSFLHVFFPPTLQYTWACRQIRIPAFSALWCQNNAVAHIWMFTHTGRTEISFFKIIFTAGLAHFLIVYRVGKQNIPEDDRNLWATRDFACSYLRSCTFKSFRLPQRLQPMEQMIQRDYILATQTYRIFALM